MRWRSMLIVIVTNIFFMLAVTILFEYLDLSERFIALENTVQEALDASITASAGSEEFFSAQYQAKMTSFAVATQESASGTKTNDTSEARILLWLDGENQFVKVNPYLMAHFYKTYNRLPKTSGEINSMNQFGLSGYLNGQTGAIYEWLYGSQGTDYRNGSLSWANRSPSRRQEYNSYPSRTSTVNDNFKEFYREVGQYHLTKGYLKERIGGTDSFSLVEKEYPTLMNMGFEFMSDNVLGQKYTQTSSSITHDNFTSTFHVGKTMAGQANTIYYLTPISLGVTYIPIEVLKPTFLATLDSMTRLNYIGGSSTSGHIGTHIADASHCVETSVYSATGTQSTHTKSTPTEDIVTDGFVEFDLDSVKMKVDYFYINFSDTAIPQSSREVIISKLNGVIQRYNGSGDALERDSTLRGITLDRFTNPNNDTATKTESLNFDSVRNGRVVARVTVKIKCHIPYKAAMLQWMCQKFGGSSNHHYDIKRWDSVADKSDTSSDGVWYSYTTYYMTSRS